MNQEDRYRETPLQEIFLAEEHKLSFILDIGGGGEGFIGKIYGNKVISIDTSENELLETENDALKIVMDGSNMNFLDSSFEVVTMFYSLMYMEKEVKVKVLNEAIRVLKVNGVLDIWDMTIPEYDGSEKDIILGRLNVSYRNETIGTSYGVTMENKQQTPKSIKSIIDKSGLKIVKEEVKGISFRIQYKKMI